MAKIYPDTNRFIDFYRAALDNINVFDELQKYKSSLVLTEQTITEFRRNRVRTLNWLVAQFRKSLKVNNPYTTSIMKELPAHKELTDLLSRYKKKGKELLDHLREIIADEKKDPIAQKFLTLAGDAAVMKLKLTDQAVNKAHRRKLLGNPPSSPERFSVGDEVIREILLDNMNEDLIVVTKDHTFHENYSLLAEEYQARTGRKLLLVSEEFSEALKTIGQAITKELIEAEKQLAALLANAPEQHRSMPYTPADSFDWADLPPTTVGEAVDRIYAALGKREARKEKKRSRKRPN